MNIDLSKRESGYCQFRDLHRIKMDTCTFAANNYSSVDQKYYSLRSEEFRESDLRHRIFSLKNTKLRLRGGVAFEDEEEEQEEIRRLLKSPIQECKSIMDKFDEILAAYKSSLGPCGEATCPYSQSMMQDSCRKKCHSTKVVLDEPPKEECQGDPCQNKECPYADKKKRFVAGCGSASCAYPRYKLGLVDQDASLEYMMLPPAISGKCGSPNCDYPIQPDLPPIHWDCPDPLPKGACKNPNCPLQSPALKKIKVPIKKNICSCQDCPYAFPPPCGLPSCPFRENPCPFLEKKKVSKDCFCPSSSSDEEKKDLCSNPSCPFAPSSPINQNVDDPTCKGEIVTCSNPNCPFATQKKEKGKKSEEFCGHQGCPWSSKLKKTSECDRIKSEEVDLCGNPTCPYAVYGQESIKPSECDKNKTSENVDLCHNPTCPYVVYAHESNDYKCPLAETTDSCDHPSCPNPNCPFEKEKTSSDTEGEVCNENKFCGNPNCSYHKRRSIEPNSKEYLKSNAECYESEEKCDNPTCPYTNNYESDDKNKNGKERKTSKVSGAIVESNIVIKNGNTWKNYSEQNNNAGTKPKIKKKRGKFVYSMGNMYPGVKIGHKECVTQVFNVPPKMGWLWNVSPDIVRLKPRRGWKPGALTKTIAGRIRAHRQAKGLGILRLPKFGQSGNDDDEQLGGDIKVTPKPTLCIQKKDGAYSIVMNPLKDPKTLVENEDPYMECTPMRFKISPTKFKKSGSQTCFCDEEDEVKSNSSESELDIEFTPPAGIIHPERFKKKMNVIHCETQYNSQDFDKTGDKKEGNKHKEGKKGGKGGKGKAKGRGKKSKK